MFDDRIGNLQKMLARMGPEGRQKYAADHADDPIAVSMALFVNNIAKEIKEGKRGEPEVQAPVVQQAIQAMNQPSMPPQGVPPQGMPPQGQPQAMPQQQAPQGETQMAANGGYMDSRLPEDMGIGALPERSLSNMADGGIVGFAEGGDIQRFQSGGVPERWQDMKILPNESGEDFARRVALARQASYQAQMFPTDEQKAAARRQALENERAKNMAEVDKVDSMSLPPRKLGPYGAPTVPRQEGVLPDQAGSGGAEDPNGAGAPRLAAPPAARPTAAAAAAAARPTAGAGAGASSNASGLASLAAQYDSIDRGGMSVDNILANRTKIEGGIKAIDPVATERAALNAKSKKFSQEALDEFEKETKDRPDPYAKREERANKQEASIAESAERNPYLSLMEAGFAMMAGDSPYALKNIGVGALVGTKAYKEGLDKIEIAKTKLSETRDKIEDYRINRDDLTAKERRAFKTDIRNTELEGDKNLIAGLALAFNRKDAQVAADMLAAQTAYSDQAKINAQIKVAQFGKEADIAMNAQNNAAALERTKYSSNRAQALPSISTVANQLRAANPNLSVEQSLTKAAELLSTSANVRATSNETIEDRRAANKQILAEGGLRRELIESEKDPVKKQILIDNWNNRQKEIRELNNISDPAKAKFVGFE